MAARGTDFKSSWRRRQRWRWLSNLAGVGGAVLAAAVVAFVLLDDIRLGRALGVELILMAIAVVAVGFFLPRYAVESIWQNRLRRNRGDY